MKILMIIKVNKKGKNMFIGVKSNKMIELKGFRMENGMLSGKRKTLTKNGGKLCKLVNGKARTQI